MQQCFEKIKRDLIRNLSIPLASYEILMSRDDEEEDDFVYSVITGACTKSACYVTEQNDKNPHGSVQGVCNTPHHAVTEYTDTVLYEIRTLRYRTDRWKSP